NPSDVQLSSNPVASTANNERCRRSDRCAKLARMLSRVMARDEAPISPPEWDQWDGREEIKDQVMTRRATYVRLRPLAVEIGARKSSRQKCRSCRRRNSHRRGGVLHR